jgi:creatinine amidohydrolase
MNNPDATVNDLAWPEVQNRIDNGCKIAILPFGHTEQHGPHLPFGSDTYFISAVTKAGAELANKEASRPIALVFPTLPFGNGGKFANGELRLSPSTFNAVVTDLMKELEAQGFPKIVLASGHGSNGSVLSTGSSEAFWQGVKADVYTVSPFAFMRNAIKEVLESDDYGHACEIETSTSLHLFPELVKLENVTTDKEQPEFWTAYDTVEAVRNGTVSHFYPEPRQVTDEMPGYVGQAKMATKEKGKKLVDEWVRGFANFLIDLDAH